MIPPRRDGTFLSRLDGKLAKAGWRVYMDKYIAGMNHLSADIMCFCHKEQLRVLRNQNSSRLAGIECLYGNLSSRLDEIPATDAGISPRRDESGII